MAEPVLHKYFDFGERALANITLTSGQRILLTIVPAGFAVHRLHLFGTIPGGCLFGTGSDHYQRMAQVIARDGRLPPLPRAKGKHQDDAATHAFLDAAAADIEAVAANKRMPGRVKALDLEKPRERPLSLLTRLALTADDEDHLIRLYERARNIPG